MKHISAWALAFLLMLLPAAFAAAEPIVLYGTVICTEPICVTSTAAGRIEKVNFAVGDRVTAGDVIATVSTQKVYASADGTVYLFGNAGDKITEIVAQYGAVAYLDPALPYTLTAKARNNSDAKISVIPGEKVYLRCNKDGKHTGVGIIVKLNGDKYTVNVTEGTFVEEETVSVFRTENYAGSSFIGRDKVNKAGIISFAGNGYLVKFHVTNGESVTKGSLLYETVEGVFPPNSMEHENIISPYNGILAAIYEKPGSQINPTVTAPAVSPSAAQGADKGTSAPANSQSTAAVKNEEPSADTAVQTSVHTIAELYPDDSLWIIAYAPESVLNNIHVNDTVSVACQYIENMTAPVAGVVEKISRVPSPDGNGIESQYAVYIKVDNVNLFYYGMNVVVTTK